MLHIEFARRNKNWTQLQLSRATRIHSGFLSLIENSQGIPNADQLDRIARALEVPADLLLKEVVAADLPREPEPEQASV